MKTFQSFYINGLAILCSVKKLKHTKQKGWGKQKYVIYVGWETESVIEIIKSAQ